MRRLASFTDRFENSRRQKCQIQIVRDVGWRNILLGCDVADRASGFDGVEPIHGLDDPTDQGPIDLSRHASIFEYEFPLNAAAALHKWNADWVGALLSGGVDFELFRTNHQPVDLFQRFALRWCDISGLLSNVRVMDQRIERSLFQLDGG